MAVIRFGMCNQIQTFFISTDLQQKIEEKTFLEFLLF